MRMGKRPTLRQKILISSKKLNPDNWLVLQDRPDALVIMHRHSIKPREIPKERSIDL